MGYKDKERQRVANRKYKAANKARLAEYRLNHRRLQQYGISSTQYDALILEQGGVCAVCGGPDPSGRRLSIDHCHTTGKVRALLCGPCNTGLGHFKDSIVRLQAAIYYLETHQ